MTYDFRIAAADTPTMYRDLESALQGLVAGETDAVANMQTVFPHPTLSEMMHESVLAAFGRVIHI